MKKCIKCEKELNIDDFPKKGGNRCKSCISLYKKEYNIKNRDKLSKKDKEYYLKNKEKNKNRSNEYYKENKEKKLEYQKEYYSLNKDDISIYKISYFNLNKEKINNYKNSWQNDKRNNDPLYKLKSTISSLIYKSLKYKSFEKKDKTIDILGCSIEFFKNYLESKFTDDMNWKNHGKVWDIDHIIPISSAKNEEEILKLNHYTNLQPLDSYINRYIKRNKLDY